MRIASLLLAFAVAASPALPARAEPLVAFDTAGGDAWSFAKRLSGTTAPGACDGVRLRTDHGETEAWFDGRRFAGTLPLRAGDNAVTALCLRNGRPADETATQRWQVRLPDRPTAWIRLRAGADAIHLDAGRSEIAPGEAAPLVGVAWSARDGNPAPLAVADATARRTTLAVPAIDGTYGVRLRVTDARGRSDESVALFRVEGGRAVAHDPQHDSPDWVADAVIYGANLFFVGDKPFADLAARLDHIAALGANALWLSPIAQAAPGDFGYAVTDPFALRPEFGSDADLRALIAAAKARGLRVILDAVPNHVAEQHPYFADAAARGPASPYHGWFDRDARGEPTHYFDWTNLKNLDYDNPEVQAYVIAAFSHWLRAYGVDGFRVDANWGVRERAPEFWARWRAELTRIDPDVLLLAEASARDPYYRRHGFDAAYDWTDRLGHWAWKDAFGDGGRDSDGRAGRDADVGALRAALQANDPATPALRFLNNNDTAARFVTRHGPARAKVAAVLKMTVPGLPLIYTGDEIGAEYEPYDEGPPLAWRDAHGLLAHYRTLGETRRTLPALRGRDIDWLASDRDDALLAYVRPGPAAADSVVVLLNFSGAPVTARLAPDARWTTLAAGPLADALTGEEIALDARDPVVELPPYGARILRRAGR